MNTDIVHDRPITEYSNELSVGLGSAKNELEILRILRGVDAQIFAGWQNHVGLLDEEIILNIEKGALMVSRILNSTEGCIIISGCGTSGRIGCMTCTYVDRILKENGYRECCEYLCSGGDGSLVLSNELQEDDPFIGAKDLDDIIKTKTGEIVYIGVTCGLSAPYVAGQIDFLLHEKRLHQTNKDNGVNDVGIILIGFNPLHLARSTIIEKWEHATSSLSGSKSFLDVIRLLNVKCEKSDKCLIINPVVGPESISGSTRMKGGSATKIILDVMFAKAFHNMGMTLEKNNLAKNKISSLKDNLLSFADTLNRTYLEMTGLNEVMKLASSCLQSTQEENRGHIYYIGKDVAGVIGVMDASEMPDTFGSSFTEFRGYIHGGWEDLGVHDKRIQNVDSLYHIATEDFEKEIIPQLSSKDLVIGLSIIKSLSVEEKFSLDEKLKQVLKEVAYSQAKVALLQVVQTIVKDCRESSLNIEKLTQINKTDEWLSHIKRVVVALPKFGIIPGRTELAEISLKWMLNAISSGAQIMNGKVVKNQMINFSPLNNKLYHRCVTMIQTLTELEDCHLAEECLLKSIYNTNYITPEMWNAPVSQHIMAATPNDEQRYHENKIMPIALLLASYLVKRKRKEPKSDLQDGMTVQEAKRMLRENPKILAEICIEL